MTNKINIDEKKVDNMVLQLNTKKVKMAVLAVETGFSVKAIQRRIKEHGYIYSRETGKYIKDTAQAIINSSEPRNKSIVQTQRDNKKHPPEEQEKVEVNTTITLNKKLLKRLKIEAINRDITLKKLIAEFLEAGLKLKS